MRKSNRKLESSPKPKPKQPKEMAAQTDDIRDKDQNYHHRNNTNLLQNEIPEEDFGELELGDIIDVPAIQSLLDNFHKLVNIPLAVIDLKGKVLVGVGWQDICTKFHRINPETCKNCIESDTRLSAGADPGEFKLYKCKNNMWDVATPIIVGGKKFGNIFSGQFFFEDESLNYDLFRRQAKKYDFDEDEYIAALEKVPRLRRDQLTAGMTFFLQLAGLISKLSYSNIKLARSVAQREQLAESFRQSEQRLKRAQEIAHLGSWELDVISNRLTWSDEVYRIFGLAPQEFAATYEAFLDRVHPDDRKKVDEAYGGSLRNNLDRYEIDHRVIRKNTGEIRIVHEKCEHFRNSTGKIIRSVGMVHDVTEQKHAEDALRAVHSELEQHVEERTAALISTTELAKAERQRFFDVLETLPVYVCLLTPDYRMPFANSTFREWFGYHPDRKCYEFLFNRTEPCENCETYTVLKTNASQRWEWTGPNGRNYSIFDFPFQDTDGSQLILEMGIDITERKRAETALKEANEMLEQRIADRTAELRQSAERLAILSDIAGQLLENKDPQTIVNTLCRRVMEHLDCQVFINYLVDKATHRLHLNTTAGLDDKTVKAIEWLDFGQAICGCVAQQGKRIVAENIQDSCDSRADLVRSFGIRAYACHPLLSSEGVIGTLSFGTRSRTSFSDQDLAMMKAVSSHVAAAMERILAEKAILNERANLQTIFDSVNVGMLLVDENGRVQRVNNAVARWIDKNPKVICGEQPGNVLGCIHALEDAAGCGNTSHCSNCYIRQVFTAALESGKAVHDVEAKDKQTADKYVQIVYDIRNKLNM